MLDLEKIQSTITAEVTKAVNADRKAIIKLVKEFNAQLIDAIQNMGDVEDDEVVEKPAKAKPAKKAKDDAAETKAKPAKKAKDEDAEDEKPVKAAKGKAAKEPEYDFTQADIDEVDDDEVDDSDYADWDGKKLKAEIKKRKISVPAEWDEDALAKVLILDDEENEEDDEDDDE